MSALLKSEKLSGYPVVLLTVPGAWYFLLLDLVPAVSLNT